MITKEISMIDRSIKIYTSVILERTHCDDPMIPIISYDNAILIEEHTDIPLNWKLAPIKRGLLKHNKHYYFFENSVIDNSRNHQYSEQFSYEIYKITEDLALKFINKKAFNYWEAYFNCMFYYNKKYISIKRNEKVDYYCYISYLDDNGIVLARNCTPRNFNEGITVGDFYDEHMVNYRWRNIDMNMNIYRNNILNEILDEK